MSDDTFDPKITGLVRQFSLGLSGDSESRPVDQALGATASEVAASEARKLSEARNFEQWLEFKYPSGDDDTQTLQNQCMKVADLWSEFGHRFRGTSRGNSLPSAEALFGAVDTAALAFDQKRHGARGKFVAGFQSFVGTLSDHSYLFSIIPDNDKYLSLVTGVLTSIAKLVEIREELVDIPKICDVGNPTRMKPRVVKLYICIFEFLYLAMRWYQSTSMRFKAAFNENYYAKEFQPKTANIRKAISKIRDEAVLITQQRVGYIVDRIDIGRNLRIAADGSRNEESVVTEAKRQLLLEGFNKIGNDSTKTLCATGEQFFYDQEQKAQIDARSVDSAEAQQEIEQDYREDEPETNSDNWVSRTDLRRQADLLLAKFTDDGRQDLKNILRGITSPMIPQELSTRIQSWIQNKGSQLLWIEGPVVTDSGSGLSLTALRIYEITMQTEIPCVSFFCKRKYSFKLANSTTSGATLLALLYTVIDQLINLLPPTFESTYKLDLDNLDTEGKETNAAASSALEVIEQLLPHAPPTATFILDGLELVNKATDIPHLTRLIELLKGAGGDDKVFKVLLTTNGNSRALVKATHWKERVDGSRFAQGRPGRVLKGATHLNEIG
ncbi:hypothetical protein PG984_015213 [Apiospora sp. TS-2023a]